MKELLGLLGAGLVIIICFFTFVLLPVAWFDGHAKSSWIKQTRGVDIPWHQATWLSVEINSADAILTP